MKGNVNMMEYVKLGSTGMDVSRFCLGKPAEDIAFLEEPYIPHAVVGAL
jgi:hypothetical protein